MGPEAAGQYAGVGRRASCHCSRGGRPGSRAACTSHPTQLLRRAGWGCRCWTGTRSNTSPHAQLVTHTCMHMQNTHVASQGGGAAAGRVQAGRQRHAQLFDSHTTHASTLPCRVEVPLPDVFKLDVSGIHSYEEYVQGHLRRRTRRAWRVRQEE